MKNKPALVTKGMVGLLMLSVWGSSSGCTTDPMSQPPSPSTESPLASASTAQPRDNPTSALAESKALEEAMRTHIRPARVQLPMATPPPPPQREIKPRSPTAGWVWVPGHWAPVKGVWKWKPGQWGAPATPISVWIESKYDEKTKIWTAGYWQPDREEPYDREQPKDAPPPMEKFF